MKSVKDKIALVTGGNSGIGYATAKELISKGATVIITGRRKDAIEKAAVEIGAIPLVADQASLKDIAILQAQVQKQFGKIDILFVNAGITGNAASIENQTEENFDGVMNINFKGAYFMLTKFIPLLSEGASVVFLSSNVATMNQPESSIYQASKAAINSIAKTAAAELAPRKIRVNIVSPGPTKTGVLDKSYGAAAQNIWEHLSNVSPLKKVGIPEDVAKLVAYLSDDAASYITGSEFVIDGGMRL